MTDLKAQVKDILQRHEGRSRAITGKELARMLGYRDDRKIRQIIEELLDDGLPIISTTEAPGGYFIPTSLGEAQRYTQSLQSRATLIFLRRKKVITNTALYLKPATQVRLL